jgi:AAA+ ATPase superfamily predicted ATPase
VYGPINSGKTSLLMRVFEELSDEYIVFYINFRGLETRRYEDFVRAMFTVKYQSMWERIKERGDIFLGGINFLEEVAKKLNYTIPVPRDLLKVLVGGRDDEMDCFKYLEEVMRRFVERGRKPVFVLDELQMLREVNKNGPVLHDLFNFLVRLTKETHLCHILCATSDCLFIEDVYNNARLEGRSDYILVDDLDRERAYDMYDRFGFREKDVIWEYIGGKIGDMVRLYEKRKQGYSEREGIERMFEDTMGKIRDFLEAVEEGEKGEIDIKEVEGALRRVLEGEILSREVYRRVRHFLVEENLLFYNPVRGVVRYQSELIRRAVSKLLG